MRHHRQDIAPDGRVFASTIVDHDNAALRHIIDKISDRAGRDTGGTKKNRESTASQPKSMVERLDAKTLAGNPKAGQRIAESGCVEFRCPPDVVVPVLVL